MREVRTTSLIRAQDVTNTINSDGDNAEHHSDNIQEQNENSKQQEKEAVGIATRRSRKTPVTRSEDFLWTTTSKRQAR
jgi:hypothetical protein